MGYYRCYLKNKFGSLDMQGPKKFHGVVNLPILVVLPALDGTSLNGLNINDKDIDLIWNTTSHTQAWRIFLKQVTFILSTTCPMTCYWLLRWLEFRCPLKNVSMMHQCSTGELLAGLHSCIVTTNAIFS